MNKIIVYFFFLSCLYSQKSLCAHSILNQNQINLNRNIECTKNQFKIRKNVLQSGTNDNYFECVDFIFMEHFSDSNTYIYVEEIEYFNGNVTDNALETLFQYFTFSTPDAENELFQNGIRDFSDNFLGLPPNKDNSNVVNILILDIRDNFSGSGNYIAGYFDRNDQTNNSTSNQKDIVYIDSNPVDMISQFPKEAIYTLAHEYEHLLHYNSDPFEIIDSNGLINPWVDEGLADLVPSILGLGNRDYGFYLANTKVGLDEWIDNGLQYYSKSALFMRYLYEIENNGLFIIQDIFNDSEYSHLESIKHVLMNYNYTNFDIFFDEWILNTINNEYNITNCIPDVSPNIIIDSYSSELITINDMPDYSFYNLLIPAGINKIYLNNLDYEDKVIMNNYNKKIAIESSDDLWQFSDTSKYDDLLYTFINYDGMNNTNEIELSIENASKLNTIKYDSGYSDNYLNFESVDTWFAGIVFEVDTSALLTNVDYMLAKDSRVKISINKGGFNYTPQIDTSICLSTANGWNRLNIAKENIFVDNESIYVTIELNDNAMGVSNYTSEVTNSYYSFASGLSYSLLTGYGNWAIRLSYEDSSYVDNTPEEYGSVPYPNPFNPNLDLSFNTFVYTRENQIYSIDIFDISGKKVKNIFKDYPRIDKLKNVTWDGTDFVGNQVSSGTYILSHINGSYKRSYLFLVLK